MSGPFGVTSYNYVYTIYDWDVLHLYLADAAKLSGLYRRTLFKDSLFDPNGETGSLVFDDSSRFERGQYSGGLTPGKEPYDAEVLIEKWAGGTPAGEWVNPTNNWKSLAIRRDDNLGWFTNWGEIDPRYGAINLAAINDFLDTWYYGRGAGDWVMPSVHHSSTQSPIPISPLRLCVTKPSVSRGGFSPLFNTDPRLSAGGLFTTRGPIGHRTRRLLPDTVGINPTRQVYWHYVGGTWKMAWLPSGDYHEAAWGLPPSVKIGMNLVVTGEIWNPTPTRTIKVFLEQQKVVKTGASWDYATVSTEVHSESVPIVETWDGQPYPTARRWSFFLGPTAVTNVGTLASDAVGFRYRVEVHSSTGIVGVSRPWHKFPPDSRAWGNAWGEGESEAFQIGYVVEP